MAQQEKTCDIINLGWFFRLVILIPDLSFVRCGDVMRISASEHSLPQSGYRSGASSVQIENDIAPYFEIRGTTRS